MLARVEIAGIVVAVVVGGGAIYFSYLTWRDRRGHAQLDYVVTQSHFRFAAAEGSRAGRGWAWRPTGAGLGRRALERPAECRQGLRQGGAADVEVVADPRHLSVPAPRRDPIERAPLVGHDR